MFKALLGGTAETWMEIAPTSHHALLDIIQHKSNSLRPVRFGMGFQAVGHDRGMRESPHPPPPTPDITGTRVASKFGPYCVAQVTLRGGFGR